MKLLKQAVAIFLIAMMGGLPAAQAAKRMDGGPGPGGGGPGRGGDDDDRKGATATPIKHVIIIVGENRSFDHLFATYTPKSKRESVLNLLSEGIVNADGSPGPNFAKAHQFKILSPPNGGKFFSSADSASKQLYATLPAPDVAGVGAVSPYAGILGLPAATRACRPRISSSSPLAERDCRSPSALTRASPT